MPRPLIHAGLPTLFFFFLRANNCLTRVRSLACDIISLFHRRINLSHPLRRYCAHDCFVTHEVFHKTYGAYQQYVPSQVSFAGMLEVTAPVLPTDVRWARYLRQAQRAFDHLHHGLDELLVGLADDILSLVETGGWANDPWYRNMDWSFETPVINLGGDPDNDGTCVIVWLTCLLA
jgi:hypothetical protein